MNVEIAERVYQDKYNDKMTWEQYLNKLNTGLQLIVEESLLYNKTLDKLQAANIALVYYREVLLYHLEN
ncbi:MAG: hypothetical protein BGO69_16735 [Bacteroidetes bacterium 46-16]|nr:MAG: hypothetical protein BGO69_16735 [Bacteroidetes bacterium 46-16]